MPNYVYYGRLSFQLLAKTIVVQVDVLETQYSLLVDKIKSTNDFEAVSNAHSEFLITLESQLFFTLHPVSYYARSV